MIILLEKVKYVCKYSYRNFSNNRLVFKTKRPPWKVLFFGSDEFSLYSLKTLFNEYKANGNVLNTLDVVTSSKSNRVWKFAEEHKLKVYKWPITLEENKYDVGVVVSFGQLIPESLIKKFPLGMLNVHASLLPKWRGAAPIIYTLANGDKETGVTIMTIKPKHFDIGEIVYQEKINIHTHMNQPELYEELGQLGARCLLDTIYSLEEKLTKCKPQPEEGISYAPKVTPQLAQIKWHSATSAEVYNLQRALKSVFPLTTTWNELPIKLFDIEVYECQKDCKVPGFVEYNRKTKTLIVECANRTWIGVKKLGIQGKKVMSATDFNNGFIKKQAPNKICCFV